MMGVKNNILLYLLLDEIEEEEETMLKKSNDGDKILKLNPMFEKRSRKVFLNPDKSTFFERAYMDVTSVNDGHLQIIFNKPVSDLKAHEDKQILGTNLWNNDSKIIRSNIRDLTRDIDDFKIMLEEFVCNCIEGNDY
ncbi:hypothetical protein JTB14_034917 [Gonioctena quinquepunctata]|nr:hypothetical protein JTB14_034917 [Gonioctena quinquepunctata]